MDWRFIAIYGCLSLLLYLGAILYHSWKSRKPTLPRSTFSLKNYYILFSPAPVAALAYSALVGSWTPALVFCAFCITGILGEVMYSLWWSQYYTKRFWVYTTDTWLNKYTSALNFIPWGLGGFVNLAVLDLFPLFGTATPPLLFVAAFATTAVVQLVVFKAFVRKRFKRVTPKNWLFFITPILTPLAWLAYRYGSEPLLMIAAVGVAATLLEYLMGKACEGLLGRKLWTYQHVAKDHGHFTPLSIPAFATGGVYFWIVYELVKALL